MPEVWGQRNVHEPQPAPDQCEPCDHWPNPDTVIPDDTDGEKTLYMAKCMHCSGTITTGYIREHWERADWSVE